MEEIVLNGKCLYTPVGAAREYAAVGCNFYRGCFYQCKYCYNRNGVLGVDHAVLANKFSDRLYRPKKYRNLTGEEYALHEFRHEVDSHLDYLRQAGIFFSFSAEPMCDVCSRLTADAMLYAVEKGVPAKIFTKYGEWCSDTLSIFENMESRLRRLVAVGFTLTGRDDLESNTFLNADRIALMSKLHEWGFHTFANIEPIIDFSASWEMVRRTVGFCDLYMIGIKSNHGGSYQDGSREDANIFLRRIFLLHQLYGLRIYYKESVWKLYGTLLNLLYDPRDAFIEKPETHSADNLFLPSPNPTPLLRQANALHCLATHLFPANAQFTLQPEEEWFDWAFFLYRYFKLYGKEENTEKYIKDFMISPDSYFDAKIRSFYQELDKLDMALLEFQTLLGALKGQSIIVEAPDVPKGGLVFYLQEYAERLCGILYDTMEEIAVQKPLLL